MLEFLNVSEQEFSLIATGIGAAIASGLMVIFGAKRGKPTSGAVAGAIQSANCRAGDLALPVAQMRENLTRIERALDEQDAERRRQHQETTTRLVKIETIVTHTRTIPPQ